MGMHWAAPLMKTLIPEDLYERLQSAQVDPNTPTKDVETLHFYNGATGDVIGAPQIPNFYRLRRSKLRKLLMEGVHVREGVAITDVSFSEDDRSVTATFSDGTTDTGHSSSVPMVPIRRFDRYYSAPTRQNVIL